MFEELCPNRTSIKDYKEDAIPLRVLSLIALAEKEGYFGKIEILSHLEKGVNKMTQRPNIKDFFDGKTTITKINNIFFRK